MHDSCPQEKSTPEIPPELAGEDPISVTNQPKPRPILISGITQVLPPEPMEFVGFPA